MAAKCESWSVPKLKAELVRRSASTRGRKTDLIERLKAYERNDNFKNPPVILPDPLEPDWPDYGFQQLREQHKIRFPKINKDQIRGYFIYRLAGDNEASSDVKALEKGEKMFASKRILACSFNQQSGFIFLSGIVGAAMKNKVTYNYKIKLSKDTGEPQNSHCECPAGKGPHGTCKHVAAVLFMLTQFVATGCVQVEGSCTDNLQTFHKPKSYYSGSPVKAEDIPAKRKAGQAMLADPRPMKYRNMSGYSDHVRNVVLNYCASTSMDIGLRYIYQKADLRQAQLDHDYLQRPLYAEHWIDQALSVTDEEANSIEFTTRGQSTSNKWFFHRKWRLTASRFGEIIKITDRRNKEKLCASLCQPPISTRPMLHGKQYEAKARKVFESKSSCEVQPAGLFVRKDYPFLGATPDGVIDEDGLVEIKCPYVGRNSAIKPGKMFSFLTYNANKEVTIKTNCHYYAQIQGQLFLAQRKYCFFIVYTFVDIFIEKVYIDQEFCTFSLIPKLALFFEKHFRPYLASKL